MKSLFPGAESQLNGGQARTPETCVISRLRSPVELLFDTSNIIKQLIIGVLCRVACRMSFAAHYFQVRRRIIRTITIMMVNVLKFGQIPAQLAFHHEAVERNASLFVGKRMFRHAY